MGYGYRSPTYQYPKSENIALFSEVFINFTFYISRYQQVDRKHCYEKDSLIKSKMAEAICVLYADSSDRITLMQQG